MQRILGLTFSLLLAIPLNANAWGILGHKVTAEIAARHLTPEARAAIERLLAGDNIVDASIWPDNVRRTSPWTHTSGYHFADVNDGMTYLENLSSLTPEQQYKGDVIMALLKAQSVLRGAGVSDAPTDDSDLRAQEKLFALKFTVHFLGDMHQPLHAGHPSDRGGNDIPINWFGKKANLHAIWDTDIMTSAHAGELKGKDMAAQVSWYADYLEAKAPFYESCDIDLNTWINDSVALARDYAYNGGYDGDSREYMRQSIPVIEAQLMRAGLRMACFLNDAFAPNPAQEVRPTEKTYALRSQINAILRRSLDSIISLIPGAGQGSGLAELVESDDHDDCH